MLHDRQGRSFPYLRLSVTDVCNFQCSYCLPNGYQGKHQQSFLSVAEIRRLVAAFAALGMWKIRITGGEPAVRRDLPEIIAIVATTPGVERIAITTNGWCLPQLIGRWHQAGLNALNVSIDSLDPRQFQAITGHDGLHEAVTGIDKALELGIEKVKVNAVLLKELNHRQLEAFLAWIKDKPITLRFIELMQTGENLAYFNEHHVRAEYIIHQLQEKGWEELARLPGAGPAREFTHASSLGRIGIIAPYAKDFCHTCNRLRVTSMGDLRLCLFGDAGASLRDLLQADEQQSALMERIRTQLGFKKDQHFLHQGNTGATPHLASCGG